MLSLEETDILDGRSLIRADIDDQQDRMVLRQCARRYIVHARRSSCDAELCRAQNPCETLAKQRARSHQDRCEGTSVHTRLP
jgi:hypothetical protein